MTALHPITLDQAREHMRFCNSYSRMETLVDLSGKMDPVEWLKLLGREWSTCDNLWEWQGALCWDTPFALIGLIEGPDRTAMMTPDEVECLQNLPKIVKIWRGCREFNAQGLSWSLNRDVAARFPFMHRYTGPGEALLIEAEVYWGDIKAIKLDRNEYEVICDPSDVDEIARHSLTDPAAS